MAAERDTIVLVAEDSLVVRALLRAQLRDRGYTVVEAADGAQALSRAREVGPDVILLDIEMPQMDGFDVLRELKRDVALRDIPVVFITGRTTADDAVRGLELGAHDYLRKPFEAAELAARVHAALRTKRLQDELRSLNTELARQATIDAMTALPNRRFLDAELARLSSRAVRHKRPLALLLIDADHFKRINDECGHQVGDAVLIALAARIQARLRAEDVLGRWGGEEFMVIAPEIADDGAATLAEALRTAIDGTPLSVPEGEIALTVSIGWAVLGDEDIESFVRRTDTALYAAKAGGRNRIHPPG